MSENNYPSSFIDRFTSFAVNQVSRRKFIKQTGSVGLTMMGVLGGWLGLSGFTQIPNGSVGGCPSPCSNYICDTTQNNSCISGGEACTCGPDEIAIMTFEDPPYCYAECDCYPCETGDCGSTCP